MSRYGSQYDIGSFTGQCAAAGTPLEPGQPCMAALCEKADEEGFERLDYSLDAWEAGKRPERLFSFWRTTVQPPNAKKKDLVDDEVLTDLFERLADDDRAQRQAFRFVLGLILMRKRLLRFVGREQEDEREYWLMEPKGMRDQPPLKVLNPNLNDDDVRELTAELGEILRGDF